MVRSPVRDTYLVFGSPQILQEDIDEVVATLQSGWIGTGPRTARFEQEFATYLGASHAVGVNSATAALHLGLLTLGLGPGDEVIVPAMTFAATANVIVHAGATPVFADVRRDTMCIDPVDVERRITPRTKALMPVHFAGRACNMQALMDLAATHGLAIVEDCAHAIETLWHGRHAGTFGEVGAFSFYVTKNVVTGEGGMFISADPDRTARAKVLALHGMSADAWKRFSDEGFKHYEVGEPGFKYNMTDLQAALGIHQLGRVESNLERRREIWRRYDAAFADLPVVLPAPEEPDTRHARHLYTLLLDLDRLTITRDQFQAELHRRRIGTGIHYRALHLHDYYRRLSGHAPGDLPSAEWISERTISLPLSPKLTDQDIDDVMATVGETLKDGVR